MPIDIIALINSVEVSTKDILKSNQVWWKKVLPVAEIVSHKIENVYEEVKGEDKKVAAIQVFDDLWFKYCDIKWIPNFLEKPLVDHLFSLAIDSAVATFNKSGVFKHH